MRELDLLTGSKFTQNKTETWNLSIKCFYEKQIKQNLIISNTTFIKYTDEVLLGKRIEFASCDKSREQDIVWLTDIHTAYYI